VVALQMLLDLKNPKSPRFWIVEAELAENPAEHVQNQSRVTKKSEDQPKKSLNEKP